MIDLHAGRVDTRPNIQERAYRGVQRYGDRRIHAIATETIWRRLAYCGVAVQNASGSRAPVNCPGCLHELRKHGYTG